ncbi:basic helix-loop-helix ARNT-like protein 1 isoform X2 [Artemia franciscana]
MEEGPLHQLPSSSRLMRNIAEKQRRDKLNGFINELSALVPTVAQAPRKLDKTSILRLAASYLRFYQNVPWAIATRTRKKFEKKLNFTKTIDFLQNLDSFLVVLSVNHAKVLHVTENVENLLSYSQADMLGMSLYHFIHPEDHGLFRSQILPYSGLEPTSFRESRGSQKSCCFRINIKGTSRNEPAIYEKATLHGRCKLTNCSTDFDSYNSGFQYPGLFHDTSKPSGLVFVGVVKLLARRLPSRLTLLETLNDEYITRHDLDPGARIVNTDHRISTITGYLSDEVTGKAALSFMHPEDLPVVGWALKLMFSSRDGEGTISYRLCRCDGGFIYLRSRGHVEYESGSNRAKSLICINTLLSEEDGKKALEQVKSEADDFLRSAASSEPVCQASKVNYICPSNVTISQAVPESTLQYSNQREPSSPDSGISGSGSDSERYAATEINPGASVFHSLSNNNASERVNIWSTCGDSDLRLAPRKEKSQAHRLPYSRCK